MAGIAVRIGTVVAERAAPYILRALPPILGGTGGVIVGEEIDKRRQEADQAKASPTAQVTSEAKEKEKCERCPPASGAIFRRSFPKQKNWMVYQARITGMVLTDNYIEEWTYLGKNFDGFQLAECHLMEAKAGHDWIFDDELDVKYTFHRDILERMMEDAKAQNPLAMPRPPVKYSWYFEQPATYKYMLPILKRIGADINVHLQP